MKTRIVHTKIWSDRYFSELTPSEKLLFLYYLTNEGVNILYLYECPIKKVSFETSIDTKTIEKAQSKFELDYKIHFYKDFLFIRNGSRYENYSGDKYDKAKKSILDRLSSDVLSWYENVTSLQPVTNQLETGCQPVINNKSKIINRDGGVGEEVKPVLDFITYFNKKSGKSYEITPARIEKLETRLKKYSIEQIKRAIDALLKSPFHTGKNDSKTWYATPDFLLRSDEQIDKWLNSSVPSSLPVVKVKRLSDEIPLTQ